MHRYDPTMPTQPRARLLLLMIGLLPPIIVGEQFFFDDRPYGQKLALLLAMSIPWTILVSGTAIFWQTRRRARVDK